VNKKDIVLNNLDLVAKAIRNPGPYGCYIKSDDKGIYIEVEK